MKTRRTYYKDYGLSREDVRKLKEYCGNMDDESKELLKQAAVSVNPYIAPWLYESIASQVSYNALDRQKYIPIGREDFYGYQRKCMYIFRNLLVLSGKYKFW